MSLVVLAIRLALFFIVTHTHARARKNTCLVLVATRLGGSQELETRAYTLAEFRTLLDMVTMCDLHVLIVVLAVGLALSLHCDKLASDLIICLACTHISFKKFAIALAIGFSDESLLKYEQMKKKKKNMSECLVGFLSVFFIFFFIFFLLKVFTTKIFAWLVLTMNGAEHILFVLFFSPSGD